MNESDVCFHNVEWPPAGARLAGPVAWVRGWIVGRAGHEFVDLRVRHHGIHRGILGLPRIDLAAHFSSARPWLPAEFIIGVPVADGVVNFLLEAMDSDGAWHAIQPIALEISPGGARPPRIEGRLESSPDGTWTVRDAHRPFFGHLDQPGARPARRQGRLPVSGWLLDETAPLQAVLATTDTLVFNHLDHSRTDAALAAKVTHAGAGRARLQGEVDCPDTVNDPACLRVYAVSAEGEVHLCFARRFQVAPEPARMAQPNVALSPVTASPLPLLPSGRPRRLLLVVRSLLPNDTTLRALDLARYLTASRRWVARLVAMEDGPLRRDFESTGVESLVLDPLPLMAADDHTSLNGSLRSLEREIWWTHLDAAVVFDPVCAWVGLLARRHGIPLLFDCSETETLAADPAASAAVRELLHDSWRAASVTCFASQAAARAQASWIGEGPAEVVLPWHTPGLPAGRPDGSPHVLVPLRAAEWLARRHPTVAAQWTFKQGPASETIAERLARQDEAFNLPSLQRNPSWSVQGIAFVLGPLFDRGPLRPVIDAAAAGIPFVAPRVAVTEEIFQDSRVRLASPANPLALAHAFLAWTALPSSWQRAADELAPSFRARHDPAGLLPKWERLLAATVTRGG